VSNQGILLSDHSAGVKTCSILVGCLCRLSLSIRLFNSSIALRGAVMNVLAVDHYIWSVLAFLEAEPRTHIDAAFQPVLFRVAQHSIQHTCEPFTKQFVPRHTLTLSLSASLDSMSGRDSSAMRWRLW